MSSENEVAEGLNSAKSQTLPIPSETVNSELHVTKGSFIGKAVHFKGDMSAREDVLIEGRVDGTIALKMNKIEIGEGGYVEANVCAKVIIVSGEMFGDLIASDQVIVTKTGRVTGDIYTADVSIEDGAFIKGSIDMQKQDVFKQYAVPDMLDQNPKSSGFAFLFKKGRDMSNEDGDDTMLLPDLREKTEIAEELTSLPVDIHFGMQSRDAERSIIGETVVLKGMLASEEDVIIQGQLDGIIYFKNCSLGVGAHAEIKGNIFVKSLVHHGRTAGDIYASDQVSIKKPAHVDGKIFSPRVSTEKGVIIMGSIEMESQDIEAIYARLHEPATVIEETGEGETGGETGSSSGSVAVGGTDTMQNGGVQNKNTARPIFISHINLPGQMQRCRLGNRLRMSRPADKIS